MYYDPLKIFHILTAGFFFTSLGYSLYSWHLLPKQSNAQPQVYRIQLCSLLFIFPLLLFQMGTGFGMIYLKSLNWSDTWIIGSISSFIVLLSSWIIFLFCLTHQTKKYRRIQSGILGVVIMSLLSLLFFMASRIV